jgi:hypothetical protein
VQCRKKKLHKLAELSGAQPEESKPSEASSTNGSSGAQPMDTAAAEEGAEAARRVALGNPSRRARPRKKLIESDSESDGGQAEAKEEPVEAEGDAPEVVCSVCNDGSEADDNRILLCDGGGCNVPVHQQCYGVKQIPDGDWLCERCKAKQQDAPCVLCGGTSGAMKPVAASEAKHSGKFVHLSCVVYTVSRRLWQHA